MCGLAGIAQKNVGELDLGVDSCLRHRGPDDYGWLSYELNGVQPGYDSMECPLGFALLVHYGLSIQDVSGDGKYNWQWFQLQAEELLLMPKLEISVKDFLGFSLAPECLERDRFKNKMWTRHRWKKQYAQM